MFEQIKESQKKENLRMVKCHNKTKSIGVCEFECECCGWKSSFSEDFKQEFKEKHNIQ